MGDGIEDSPQTTVIQPDFSLGPEWAALEIVCQGRPLSDRVAALESLLNDRDLDYDVFIGLAARQKLLPALAQHLKKTACFGELPDSVRDHLFLSHRVTIARNVELTREAARIGDILSAAGIPAGFTKGVVLQFAAYGGDGTRDMSDLDLMFESTYADQVVSVLEALGYEQSDYDDMNERLVPLSREWELYYKLSQDHLPPRMRLHDSVICPVLMVDCALSLTWANAPWQVDMGDITRTMSNVAALCGSESCYATEGIARLPSLSPAYTWLFTALHLFREAWVQRTADEQRTTLSQFRDVVQYWMLHGSEIAASVSEVIEVNDLAFPIAWVSQHADALLGSTITHGLGLSDTLTARQLNSAIDSSGEPIEWLGSMRKRLYSAVGPDWAPEGTANRMDLLQGSERRTGARTNESRDENVG